MTDNKFSRRGAIAGTLAAAAGLAALPAKAVGPSERLKITRVELFSVAVPFQPDIVNSPELAKKDLAAYGKDALEMVDKTPHIIIKVHTDSGLFGIGDTGRGAPMAGAQKNAEYLKGKNVMDLDLSRLHLPDSRSAEAFETACYDAVGKAMGWPVYQLLGGLAQEKIAANYWCGRKNPQDVRRVAERTVKGGFKVLKMKCHDFDDPIVATVRAVADAAPGVKVNVDFNETYPEVDRFLPMGRALEAIGNMHTFEDPIPGNDMAGYTKMARELQTPVTRTVSTPETIYATCKAEACDYINTSEGPAPISSLMQFVINSAVAGGAGRPVWHGSGCELGVRDAAMIQVCAAAGNCTLPSDIISHLRVHDLLVHRLQFKDGYIKVPTTPGLGVELDEDAVQRYRYKA